MLDPNAIQNVDTSTFSGLVAGVIASVVGATLLIQRLLKSWKETSAETSVISLMHTELNRLAQQNSVLTEELAKFQLEVIRLNKQLNDLSVENNRLHSEVVILTHEVSRLQEIIRQNPDYAAMNTQELAKTTYMLGRKEVLGDAN